MWVPIYILAAVFAVSFANIIGVRVETSVAEITACNADECNLSCTVAGFEGGLCKNGQCWCWKMISPAQRVGKRMDEIQIPSRDGFHDCENANCDRDCNSQNQNGGFCNEGLCWCRKQEESGGSASLHLNGTRSELQSASLVCNTENCNLQCKGRRQDGGSCKKGECMCWRERPQRGTWLPRNDLETKFKDKSGNEVEACTESVQCLDACQHHGAAGGFCLKRVCWCSMSYDRKAPSNRRVRPVIDLQGNITSNSLDEEATCIRAVCNQSCRTNNRGAGVCLYGYCWCSETRKREQELVWRKMSNIPQ